MLDLPSRRVVNKFIKRWWERVKSPYKRRAFLEAPRENFVSKYIRQTIDLLNTPSILKPIIPFRFKGRELDKKK